MKNFLLGSLTTVLVFFVLLVLFPSQVGDILGGTVYSVRSLFGDSWPF